MAVRLLSNQNVNGDIDVNHSQNAITYVAVTNTNTGVAANSRVQVVGESAQLDMIATSAGYTGVTGWADSGIISTDSGASGGLKLNSQAGGIQLQIGTTSHFYLATTGNVGINDAGAAATSLSVKDTQDSAFTSGISVIRSANSDVGYINMVGGAFNLNSTKNTKLRVSDTTKLEVRSSGINVIGETETDTLNCTGTGTFGGIVTTDKIFVAKGQNVSHGTSQIKISQEDTTKSQIRFYGADTSTAGILEFTGSSSDGSVGGVRLTINANGSSVFTGQVTTSQPNSGLDYPILIGVGSSGSGVIGYQTRAQFKDIHNIAFNIDAANSGSAQWVKVGTLTNFAQSGYTFVLTFYGHTGYNASNDQDYNFKLFLKTSNGSSTGSSGAKFNTWVENTGKNGASPALKWINTDGSGTPTVGGTGYELYMNVPAYVSGSIYTVDKHSGNWTSNNTLSQSDPGNDSSTVLQAQNVFNILNTNVGIGTASPSGNLEVQTSSDTTIAISNSSSVTSGNRGNIAFYNSAVSTVALIRAGAVTDNVGSDLQFYTRPVGGSLTQRFRIDEDGVAAFTSDQAIGVVFKTTDTSYGAMNIYRDHTNTTRGAVGYNASAMYFGGEANTNSIIQAGGQVGIFVSKDSPNNVGIGTTLPATKLQVANAGEVIVRSSMTAADGFRGGFEADNQHTGGTIWSMFSTNNSDGYFGGGKFVIANETMGSVDVNTPSKFVIDGGGSVLIGDGIPSGTPEADYRSLEIGRQGNTITGAPWKSNLYLTCNATITGGSSAFTYRYASEAPARMDLEDGIIRFYNAAAGTAGNTISWSERMRIEATTGYIGINNTAPDVRLEIGNNDSDVEVLSVRYSTVPAYISSSFDGTNALSTFSTNQYNTSDGSAGWGSMANASYGASAIQLATDTTGSEIRMFTAPAANQDPTQRMTISEDGNVGIGTTSPGAQLHNYSTSTQNVWLSGYGTSAQNTWGAGHGIFAAADNGLLISKANAENDTNRLFSFYHDAGGNAEMYMYNTGMTNTVKIDSSGVSFFNGGNVGIGTTSPTDLSANTNSLTVGSTRNDLSGGIMYQANGNIKAQSYWDSTGWLTYVNSGTARWYTNGSLQMELNTGGTLTVSGDLVAYGSPSDKRLKENIKPIKSALDKVSKLQGVTFNWKESGSILELKEDVGFIAQDVQKVMPELVRENKDGMLSIRHQGIAPILLEAIKELKAEIEELKKNR